MKEYGDRPRQISPEQSKPNERLSENRLGELLAAVGNHEGKALLLVAMDKPNHVYDMSELHGLMRENQQAGRGWIPGYNLPFEWSQQSLAPIGLVAREIVERKSGKTIGYRRTASGEKEGASLAGHLLAFSESDPAISLYKLFGATQSRYVEKPEEGESEKAPVINRSPLTRYRIFYELASANGDLREIDILTSLHERFPQQYSLVVSGGNTMVSGHLDRLSRSGLIDYETGGVNAPITTYRLADERPLEQPSTARALVSLTGQVYTLFQKYPQKEWTYENTAEMLQKEHGKIPPSTNLGIVFSHLAKEGYVSRETFGKERRSTISLSPQQRERLEGAVTILDRFAEQEPDFLEEGREKAREIISDPGRVATLMQKAQEASPYANRTDKAETLARIEAVIAAHPGCTTRDILHGLKERYQRNLGQGVINMRITELSQFGGLSVTAKGNERRFLLERRMSGAEMAVFEREKSGS